MSERDDELEIQAIQRELDDAFETTRPRAGFEDELWVRMQAQRPAANRLRDALAGFFQGIREVPAVPMAAVAATLVVVIGIVVIANSGVHFGGASSTAGGGTALQAGSAYAGSFGRLPSPVFNGTSKAVAPPNLATPASGAADTYYGPLRVTWSGQLKLAISSAPVFRYREPSTNKADEFASALGAVLVGRPDGFLGQYEASDYTLKVRGTVPSPPQSPAYFIFSSLSMPAINASGAGPADIANLFLAEHSLSPQWPYTVDVQGTGDQQKVRFFRQFDVPGYQAAYLVDVNGDHGGLEVDLNGNVPVLASGPLPMSLDSAGYAIISADDAARMAVGSSPPPAATATPPPTLELTHAELVYVLVPSGDHSFYEPAFDFSGTVQANGTTYTKHVLVPAVVPSQRTP